MEAVHQTRGVKDLIKAGTLRPRRQRGRSFTVMAKLNQLPVDASDTGRESPADPAAASDIHVGGLAPGMNTAARCRRARYCQGLIHA